MEEGETFMAARINLNKVDKGSFFEFSYLRNAIVAFLPLEDVAEIRPVRVRPQQGRGESYMVQDEGNRWGTERGDKSIATSRSLNVCIVLSSRVYIPPYSSLVQYSLLWY